MIKTIKIGALASSILLIIGILFKSQHLMGADVVFATGGVAGIITAVLMISFFAGKQSSGLEKFSVILSAVTIVFVLLGFLFKVMHWPGAAKLIWVADIGLILSGILFLVDGVREKDPVRSILKIMIVFFILFLLMLIVLTT